jgi:hypothetical protein
MARPCGDTVALVVVRQLAWIRETLGWGGGSESPSVLDHDEGHWDGQAVRQHRRSRLGVMARVELETLGIGGGRV